MTQRLAEILAEMVMASLDAKERRATRVERCPGCLYGSETVGSSGDPASPIAIVGEAPGRTEVKQGRPFVGPAGKTLRKAVEGGYATARSGQPSCSVPPGSSPAERLDGCLR
jgi:uracil-DNA glycosylase